MMMIMIVVMMMMLMIMMIMMVMMMVMMMMIMMMVIMMIMMSLQCEYYKSFPFHFNFRFILLTHTPMLTSLFDYQSSMYAKRPVLNGCVEIKIFLIVKVNPVI